MSPRVVKQAEVRRSEIIDVATELFAARGYDGTTMTEILEAAGITKGGLYHHFASKDEVFAACVDRVAAGLASRFVTVLEDASMRPRARVLAYLRLGYTSSDDLGSRSAIVHDLHRHGGRGLHENVIDGVQEQVVPAFARAIEQGRNEGDYAFEGDPAMVAVAVIGMLRAVHERYASEPDATELVPPELVIAMVERMLDVRSRVDGSLP
jgi:AcrR family transcriptional regulator